MAQKPVGKAARGGQDSETKKKFSLNSCFAVLATFIFIFIFFSLTMAGVAVYELSRTTRELPELNNIMIPAPKETSKVYSRNGEVIAELYEENREFASYQEIPPVMQLAIIAIEDERFYKHHGADLEGIARAAVLLVKKHGKKSQGASTITQQLVRGIYLTNEKTYGRKIREIMMSLALEKKYSKDEILTAYLNYIYFGHGAHGVKTAARNFFGKNLKDLTLDEAAILAAIPKSPDHFSPYTHPARALNRRNLVLQKMRDLKFISAGEYAEAASKPISVKPLAGPGYEHYKAPYFVNYVLDTIQDPQFPYPLQSKDIFTKGYKIYTTIDLKINHYAEDAVKYGLKTAKDSKPYGINISEGALVAMDPKTGEILAMVGGADYKKTKFNRAVQALRQPGSSFKPFTYLTALAEGFTMESTVLDAPVCYKSDKYTKSYCPQNYDHSYKGMIPLRTALIQSRNVPAVKIAKTVGLKKVIDTARKLGITSNLSEYPSMPLGAFEVTLLELTNAYAAIANGGNRVYPTAVVKIEDSNGVVVYEKKPQAGGKVLDDNVIARIIPAMEDVIKYGTGTKARIDRPAAGKTGTTSDYRDAWFMGFTPEMVAGVWLGNDDNSPLRGFNRNGNPTGAGITGGMIPAPTWAYFMKKALEDKEVKEFDLPEKKSLANKYVSGGTGVSYASHTAKFGNADENVANGNAAAAKKKKKYNLLEPDILDFNQQQDNGAADDSTRKKDNSRDNSEELF